MMHTINKLCTVKYTRDEAQQISVRAGAGVFTHFSFFSGVGLAVGSHV